MAKELKFGLMGQSTMENGLRTKLMEKESSGMLMETFTMGNGRMIKLMVMASTCM